MGRAADQAMLDTYRRVIAMHQGGQSLNSIAVQLNAEGVPTARGGKWAAATVRRMVLSETAKSL